MRRPVYIVAIVVAVCTLVLAVVFRSRAPSGREDGKGDAPALRQGELTHERADGDSPPTLPVGEQEIWFDNVAQSLFFEDAELQAYVQYVWNVLSGRDSDPAHLPADVLADERPRIVFLSLSDGKKAATIVRGTGIGLTDAALDAASEAQEALNAGLRVRWLRVDIARRATQVAVAQRDTALDLDRTLYGMALPKGSGLAFLPGEIVANCLLDHNRIPQVDNILAYLGPDTKAADIVRQLTVFPVLPVFRFRVKGFFADGDSVLELYRGHRQLEWITGDEVLSSARRAGEYLCRAVKEDGEFVYIYDPVRNIEEDDYNIVRHAGTIYSMAEAYEVTRDEGVLAAMERAIEYMLAAVQAVDTKQGNTACVVQDGYTCLGGNALAAVALAKYTQVTDKGKYLTLLRNLGLWIQDAQEEDGHFLVQKQSFPDGELVDFESVYYPGEALLALVRIHDLLPADGWLDSAEAGATWLIKTRDKGLGDAELPHDHWLLYALNELFRKRSDPTYLTHAMRIANAIVQSQSREPPYKDWLGSFYVPPRSTPTATRMEGLCATYFLARDMHLTSASEAILRGLRLGIGFQLQLQYRPESVMYFADPQRALGGFPRSYNTGEIRIDYVQHNISALLAMYRIIADSVTQAD